MSIPHDPDDDSAPGEAAGEVSAEEAAWRAIVDNYGERPQIEEPEAVAPAPPRREEPPKIVHDVASEEHYRPPTPPPLPMPSPVRLLAWLGLFGVPTLVLVALVAGLEMPNWLGLVLMVWFVGGFVYLVASMRPPRDDHDDGAVL